MHRQKQQIYELQAGAYVAYHGTVRHFDAPDESEIFIGRFVRRETGLIVVEDTGGIHRLVPSARYLYTLTASRDLRESLKTIRETVTSYFSDGWMHSRALDLAIHIWCVCELNYGIDAEGSVPKDQVRQVAFLILKGDPIARDVATDILRG